MTTRTVYVTMSKARLLQKLYSIPKLDKSPILKGVGAVVFRRIQKAFITKSRGGTDEAGDRWRPLARITVLKRLRKRQPTTDRPSSALNTAQREKWWAFYRQALARYHEKDIAAKIAWAKLKRSGGTGLFDKYAGSVLIMRETEELYNSLEPGAPKNIFRIKRNVAELGTSRRGAKSNHFGGRNLPRRRLWPDPKDWPSSWWKEILDVAREEMIEMIVDEL